VKRQFDVFENPSSRSRAVAPFVVVMQSHFMDEMPTTLVAPMIREQRSGDFTRVSVPITLGDATLYLSLAEIAPIRRDNLKHRFADVRAWDDDIRRALDRLFTGF
jgi:hypothetical protein